MEPFLFEAIRNGWCKLRPGSRRTYDEEDAALSAFHSVCAGITAGRFPELDDRDSLWALLLVITCRKVMRRHRHDNQDLRDVRRTSFDTVFASGADDSQQLSVQQLSAREPSPEFAAVFAETCQAMFDGLDDPALSEIVSLRIEGYSDSEIAGKLNCSRSTVQRRLEVIRRQWQRSEACDE